MKQLFLGVAVAATMMMSACHKRVQVSQYPQTKKCDTVDVYFGTEVADPYRWLENDTSKETEEWVAAENAVTEAYLKQLPMRDKLAKRMMGLANYERIGAPKKHQGKWYFYHNDGLQNQDVVYVKDSLEGEARVFLDPNSFSEDQMVSRRQVCGIQHLAQRKRLEGNICHRSDHRATHGRPYRMGEVQRRGVVRRRILLQHLRPAGGRQGVLEGERGDEDLLPQDRHAAERG